MFGNVQALKCLNIQHCLHGTHCLCLVDIFTIYCLPTNNSEWEIVSIVFYLW